MIKYYEMAINKEHIKAKEQLEIFLNKNTQYKKKYNKNDKKIKFNIGNEIIKIDI